MKDHSGTSIPLWTRKVSTPAGAPLTEDVDADVCVIGAGIAGVTTGYFLAREGRSVVLVDDARPSSGQTARTTAHLANAIDDRIQHVERLRGTEAARLAVQSHGEAIDWIERLCLEEHIDADFRRLDGYLFLGEGDTVQLLEEEYGAALRAGLNDVELCSNAPLGDFATGPALRFPRQGRFHPVRYLAGLAEAFLRRGGRFFSHAHVTDVHGGERAEVRTAEGPVIRAGSVVVATNAPITNRFALQTKMHPYLTYVVAFWTEADRFADALFWDTEDPYHYVRLQEDAGGTLVIVGGEDHRTGQATDHEERYSRLEAWSRARLSNLGPVAFRWSGQVYETLDGLGFIGRNPLDAKNVYVATGDSGMGMTHGTIAGRLLCDLIQGRAHPWEALYAPSRKPAGAITEYLLENANVALQYGDYFTPGDRKSVGELAPGEGGIVRRGFTKIAAYRDESGVLHECHAVCPHWGGVVRWNSSEKTWDCPVHGSRFAATGRCIQGPAVSGLAPLTVDNETAATAASAGSPRDDRRQSA
jgi:glycine/D-amino acid oxidase-like deaminating enzyme/nitrite reductase/ring-hydroxylating ferredoxin subunit